MNNTTDQVDLIEAPDLEGPSVSGRASWDSRGNSVWEWQTAPGVYTRDIDTMQLRALQITDLCLADAESSAGYERSTKRAHTELVMPTRRKGT